MEEGLTRILGEARPKETRFFLGLYRAIVEACCDYVEKYGEGKAKDNYSTTNKVLPAIADWCSNTMKIPPIHVLILDGRMDTFLKFLFDGFDF